MHRFTSVWARSALFVAVATASASLYAKEENAVQLSNVVVSAAGFEQRAVDAPATVTVITAEDLKNKRVVSLADALKDVEGVDISPSAGKTGGLNIRIRGMGSAYSLVLIDGRRQNSTGDITPNGFGESNNNFIPPISAIERIEIIRGPASTLYGSDAMGGVINVITRKVSDAWTGSIKAETTLQENDEFGNHYVGEVFATGPVIEDVLGLQIRARQWDREQSNLTKPVINGLNQDLTQGNNPTKAEITSYGGRLTLTPNNDHELSIDFDKAEQWYDNSNGQLGTNTIDGGYADAQEYERTKYVLAYSWNNAYGRLDSSLARNESNTIGRYIPSRAQGVPSNQAQYLDRDLHSEDVILDIKYVSNAFDNHNVTIGAQYWDASISDSARTLKEVGFVQTGLFIEDTISVFDSLAITLGARYDNHDHYGDFFTPRAYAVWTLGDHLTVKGGYSEGYKSPRLEQLTMGLSGIGSQGRSPSLGNPDLIPETSQNKEVGFYFDSLQGLRANVTYFISDIDNKINTQTGDYVLQIANGVGTTGCTDISSCEALLDSWGIQWDIRSNDTLNLRRPENADKAEIQGVEFGLGWDITQSLTATFNYTWTDAYLISANGVKERDAETVRDMANVGLNWMATHTLDVWFRGEYRGSELRTDENTAEDLGNYKSYTQFHLGGNWQATNHLAISAGIYNLLDRNFSEYDVATVTASNGSTSEQYVNRYKNTQEGRRLQLSATLAF